MAEERAAAAGMYLTALPKKPQRRNTNNPEALSASEGSGQGIPACSSAWPEAQPLTGEIRNDPTTSSTPAHHQSCRPHSSVGIVIITLDPVTPD